MTTPKHLSTHSVISKDGTKFGYRQLGAGPGIILVHGGLMTSQNFMKLGEALSDEFTVYIPDRRGRGLSGAYGSDFSLMSECGDIQAIVHQTNTQNIFGLSSGAVIALQTAITEPALKKVALYEPPIPLEGISFATMHKAYEDALAKGNLGKAFISIVKGTGDSSILTFLPAFITAPFMNFAMKAQEAKMKPGEVSLKALIPTFKYDRQVVEESVDIINKAKNLKADLLLLGGSKSQKFLKLALDELKIALPGAKRIEFAGLGHLAANNSDQPDVIAKELKNFF
jgi:pimeloyl-ACP methyl ester carboxylesterase